MSFDVVDLVQGTPDWLRWRHDGIGASDAAALMDENPWRSSRALFAEKVAPPRCGLPRRWVPNTTPAPAPVQLAAIADLFGVQPLAPQPPAPKAAKPGSGLEAQARRLYIAAHGSAVAPACLVSTRHPWLRASLDGIDLACARAIEIKCGSATYAQVARTGRVPGHYIGQLQQTLAVTGYDSIDFWVWHPGKPPLLTHQRRDELYIERLVEVGASFWTKVTLARARNASQLGFKNGP